MRVRVLAVFRPVRRLAARGSEMIVVSTARADRYSRVLLLYTVHNITLCRRCVVIRVRACVRPYYDEMRLRPFGDGGGSADTTVAAGMAFGRRTRVVCGRRVYSVTSRPRAPTRTHRRTRRRRPPRAPSAATAAASATTPRAKPGHTYIQTPLRTPPPPAPAAA